MTPLHKIRVVQQRTGRLEISVSDQFAKFTLAISSLQKQYCMVAVAAFNSSFVLKIDTVGSPFESTFMSDHFQKMAIAKFKEQIFSHNPYYFSPSEGKLPQGPLNESDDESEKKSPFDT